MLNLCVILFVISVSTACCDETNPTGFNETLEKEKFKEFFIKIYKLRLTPDANITNATHTRSRRSDTLVRFYDAEQKRAKWEQIAASDELDKETVNLIAEKAWNPAGKIVRKTFVKGGSIAGGFAGANIGAVLGATLGLGNPAFVIAGVFIGKKFGQELGALAGAIAGDYVNNFIAHNIIADSVLLPLVQEFTSFIEGFSDSDDTNCRSDMCSLGYAEYNCKCIACNGPGQYSNKGDSFCRTCPLGKIPSGSYYDNAPTRCVNCPRGKFGKSDGKCHSCATQGPMRYNSLEGQTTCIDCPLGSYPSSQRIDCTLCSCRRCSRGTFGKSDGKCYDCKTEGPLKYSDVDGAASCKTCIVGTSPYPTEGPKECEKCRSGEFGKLDGKCYNCKDEGPMRYSDAYGSTVCKTCPLGTIPVLSYRGPYKCEPCDSGTYGKNDGKCHDCKNVGPMSYSDIEGASLCKTCPLGSYPYETTQPFMCFKCSVGFYGKSDGKCYKCDGPMSYSDDEGSVSCKTCRVGSQAFRIPGSTVQVNCIYCLAFPGTVGTTRGCLRPDQVVMTSTTAATSTTTTSDDRTTQQQQNPITTTTGSETHTTRPIAPVSSTKKHSFTIITTTQQTTQPNPVVTTKQTSPTSNNPTTPFQTTSNSTGNYGNQTSSSTATSKITADHLITAVLLSSSLLLILTQKMT